jgi:predicted MFS family arabinose efflux permease
MLNLIVSLAAGLLLFVIGCVIALQIVPGRRSSRAVAMRISASCAVALIAAMALYIYLEG